MLIRSSNFWIKQTFISIIMEIFHVTFATTSSCFEISRYLLKLVNFFPTEVLIANLV